MKIKGNKISIILLCAIGILFGTSIGLFASLGDNFLNLFLNFFDVPTKYIAIFFVAIFMLVLCIVCAIGYYYNKKELSGELSISLNKKVSKNKIGSKKLSVPNSNVNYHLNINDMQSDEDNYDPNLGIDYIDNNLDYGYQLETINEPLHFNENENLHNSLSQNHTNDVTYKNENNATTEQPIMNNMEVNTNSSTQKNDVVLKVYLKPGQTLPKGYFFNNQTCKIEKLPNYDEIIRQEIDKQLSARVVN